MRYSITAKYNKGVRKAIQQIPDDAWVPISYWLEGGADVAETSYRPFGKRGPAVRLIVRRVRLTPGSQLALDVIFDYHPFITDREGATLELDADHRRHAEVEPAICDLKHGLGLEHLPLGSIRRQRRLAGAGRHRAQPGPDGSGWVSRRSRPRRCASVTWPSRAG